MNTDDFDGSRELDFQQQNEEVAPSPGLETKSIQAIDCKSVHQICSGQVVLTLATAVKELVENSIDAGATTVDIRLKEYGSECIEVTDNGTGVEEKNFEGLTLKHYTSKLSDFSDLINVATFGFRGEALSSLCALSNMVVVTRHVSAAVGTKLEFDADGKIVCRTPIPRQQGTTVTLHNLFHTLPVRHREFQRNLKKEFGKMIQVLNAYCLVNTGVRITCSNQTAKGSRSTIVSTTGNATVKDNIANIFGPKQLQNLLPFEQRSPTEDVCSDYGIKRDVGQTNLFSIEGFVSKCEHGQGRSSSDRQFLFINRRPCDATKILKVVNEVYHSYNRHQYPFVVLLISMAKESVDVNVTPDKRQIFMEGEKILLATLKTSLIQMFEPTTSVLRVNMVPHQSGSSSVLKGSTDECDDLNLPPADDSSRDRFGTSSGRDLKDGGLSSLARLKRSFSSAFDKSDRSILGSSPASSQPDKQRKVDTFLKKSISTPPSFSSDIGSIKQFFSTFSSPSKKSQGNTNSDLDASQTCDTADVVFIEHTKTDCESGKTQHSGQIGSGGSAPSPCVHVRTLFHSSQTESHLKPTVSNTVTGSSEVCPGDTSELCPTDSSEAFLTPTDVKLEENFSIELNSDDHESSRVHSLENYKETSTVSSHFRTHEKGMSHSQAISATGVDTAEILADDSCLDENSSSEQRRISDLNPLVPTATDTINSTGGRMHKGVESLRSLAEDDSRRQQDCGSVDAESRSDVHKPASLSITVTEFDECSRQSKQGTRLPFSFQRLRECLSSPEMSSKQERKGFARSFRAKMCPGDNQSAEDELQREISKDMFEQMEVLGQFNLGFIIVKNNQDLFIVDQHATDEKYNFEMLQRHTVIQSQQLIHPQSLELTASNEIILMDNLDIFKKNGFDFVINENAPATQRIKLKSTPISKNWNFGRDDIEELIFMLTDAPGIMCRPSRVRMMFASRACRKSVMIGTALNQGEMKKLLCHMGGIEQPWNCPHGRPTMRHLINLNMLPT